jgi:hypothetical protein
LTTLHVEVVRVFIDPGGRFGNPLGLVAGHSTVGAAAWLPPAHATVGGHVHPAEPRTITI